MTGSSSPRAPLWVLTGPTASGKTGLALRIAERLGLEIASMDSMAIYRQMDIGTAKPTADERARVPHHLVDVVEPSEEFDAARWCSHAQGLLDQRQSSPAPGQGLVFAGGTSLYLMAFFKGMMEGPAADQELRERLMTRESERPGCLYEEMARRDPAAGKRIHRNDLKRQIRALEVLELTGKTISEQQDTFASNSWRRPCRIVALSRTREDLHVRVKRRTEAMLDAGLLDEVKAIRSSGGFSVSSAAAIGYAECIQHLAKPFKDREELRNRIRRATHRLVRRQMTWLRRLPEVHWLEPDPTDPDRTIEAALDHLQS